MRFYIFFLFFLLTGVAGFSQEILTGLQTNPMVKARISESGLMKNTYPGYDTIPMELPFFDDFSANAVFPSKLRWIDNFAFENDDLPVYPVNLGVMTLDAINDSGNMYPLAIAGPEAFIADRLTSRYVRLDSVFSPVPRALTPADSVYFSFYYQPQGRGRAPQANDSLILQFLVAPAHDSLVQGGTITVPDHWQQMWYANGMPLDTFYLRNNRYFAQVMIPVKDTVFFKKKFRFRFYNYVSLASPAEPSWQSNTDHWNLDNVYLNIGRNVHDSLYRELRFIYRPPSLLKHYESMPYPQYCNDPTNELRSALDILMSNRDIVPHLSSYNYYITEPGGSFSKTYSGGEYNIQPYSASNPYVTYPNFAHPPFTFMLPVNSTDSATFLVKHVVREVTPGSTIGDTMQAYQTFYNYFAYDDGTPEASYGLTPAGSKLAYRFKLNRSPDTLRAVRMYFNKTLSNASRQFFYLCVWNDNSGKPGDTIFSVLVLPRYADSINKFVTYPIYPPLSIIGTFYVGLIQTTDDNLSIGYDRYNNSQTEIFINTFGTWTNSAYAGSLMIRPVVGKPIPLGTADIVTKALTLSLWPNPCSGSALHLRIPSTFDDPQILETATISISDLVGHVVRKSRYCSEIDVTTLANGIYFLEFRDLPGIHRGVAKFIISR